MALSWSKNLNKMFQVYDLKIKQFIIMQNLSRSTTPENAVFYLQNLQKIKEDLSARGKSEIPAISQ